jgi:hypothetical protein
MALVEFGIFISRDCIRRFRFAQPLHDSALVGGRRGGTDVPEGFGRSARIACRSS